MLLKQKNNRFSFTGSGWLASAGLALLCMSTAARAGSVQVALCAPLTAITHSNEYDDMRRSIENNNKGVVDELGRRQQKLKDLQQHLTLLKPGTSAYDDQNTELNKESIETEVWAKVQNMSLQRQQKQRTKQLYEKTLAAIEAVAKAKGVNLVIADQHAEMPDNEQMEKIDLQTLNSIIVSRNVLYSDADLDITQDVIVKLNQDYQKQP